MEIKIIKTEEQYKIYLKRMREIFNAEEGSPESDELDMLALVLDKYEEEYYPIPEPDPISAIQFMMEQMGINDKELGEIINSRSRVSEILNRKRKLTLAQIRTLTKHLKIPADVLIKEYELVN
jgi:HTH-type transcriptional regulator/antitoxin HigA